MLSLNSVRNFITSTFCQAHVEKPVFIRPTPQELFMEINDGLAILYSKSDIEYAEAEESYKACLYYQLKVLNLMETSECDKEFETLKSVQSHLQRTRSDLRLLLNDLK
jgi:hypothetical protein